MIENKLEKTYINMLEERIKEFVTLEANKIIDDKVAEFRRTLESKKGEYVNEIMKDIKVYHESSSVFGTTYKIEIVNRYEVKND